VRKLIMWNMLTAEGSVGGSGRRELADRLRLWGEELLQVSLDQARTVDALLLGRASYELMSEYWSSATGDVADLVNATPKVVFSRTLKRAGWSNTRLVTADPASEVARMKRQRGRDLLLLGRSALSSLLLERGLVDEWRLAVTPLVPGASDPRRDPDTRPRRMALLETRRLSSGCLIVRYGQMRRFGSPRVTGSQRAIAPAALTVPNRRASPVDGPFIETKEWLLRSTAPRD
jgi:dihydrofolate reductase